MAGFYNCERLYETLKSRPTDVVINPSQALQIWKVFRSDHITREQVASLENRAFLQAALMAAMDGSAAMGYIEALFKSAYTPEATVSGIMKALAKEAFQQYFHKASIKKLKDIKLYKTVVTFIAYENRPYFDIIEQGLDSM